MAFGFDSEEVSDLLEDFSESVEINGLATRAIIDLKPKVSDGMGGLIVEDPSAKIASTDVETIGIEGGESGSTLLVGNVWYRIVSVMDDGDGLTTLRLAAA